MRYPKNHKANNPNKDVIIIYESGGRDIENPYSGDALEALEDETEGELEDESEGSFVVDVRNFERNDEGGYPKDQEKKWSHNEDIRRYPSYYSKKGAPRGQGYPTEEEWWQKSLSFVEQVRSRYLIQYED